MSKREFLEIPNFALQKGGVLPLARLAYRTIGKLNEKGTMLFLFHHGILEVMKAVNYICVAQTEP
ncbi:hypothetical protein [Neoaquamicrobium sediminum]|uniref:hypothetical protein n=1 Tax=Neoaquamicrobium sediminum TaxID=1849104 RepID=UPI001565F950|nr:hypothetical protein [Mesorhizobium sediminum]NRC57262.1 hypothetical protein [Mesorhizobium sediminum]